MRWPLAEALIAHEARSRREALEQYRFEQLLYVIGGRREKPRLPRWIDEEQKSDR